MVNHWFSIVVALNIELCPFLYVFLICIGRPWHVTALSSICRTIVWSSHALLTYMISGKINQILFCCAEYFFIMNVGYLGEKMLSTLAFHMSCRMTGVKLGHSYHSHIVSDCSTGCPLLFLPSKLVLTLNKFSLTLLYSATGVLSFLL